MRNLRKRKVADLSIIERASKKIRGRSKRFKADSSRATNSVKANGFVREVEVVLDKSIVNKYLDSKDLVRKGLDLTLADQSSTTLHNGAQSKLIRNISCETKSKQPQLVNHTGNQIISNRLLEVESVVKLEMSDDSSDRSTPESMLFVEEEEMIDVEYLSDDESNIMIIDNPMPTEKVPKDLSSNNTDQLLATVQSIKVEPTEITIEDYENDTIDVDTIKSEEIILNDSRQNDKRDVEYDDCANSNKLTDTKESMKDVKGYMFCKDCNFKTKSKPRLRRHIHNAHMDKKGYLTCEKCQKKFRTDKILKFHETVCGTVLILTCKFCPKTALKKLFLRRHIISQHPHDFEMGKLDEIMQDIVTDKQRIDKNSVDKIKEAAPIKRFKSSFDRSKLIKMHCSTCDVISERGRAVIPKNCSKCNTKLMFQCQMCGNTYDKITTIRHHVKWSCKSAETKLIGDTTALSKFSHEKNVIVHTNSNCSSRGKKDDYADAKGIYKCKKCRIKKANSKICMHIEYKHAGCRYENKMAACEKCNRKFSLLQHFVEHKIACGINFLYACPFCHYTSKNPEDPKRHMISAHPNRFDMKNLPCIMEDVRKTRNKIKDKYIAERRLEQLFKPPSDHHGLIKKIKLYCSDCCIHDPPKSKKSSKFCSNCENLLEYQCQACGRPFISLKSAESHIQLYCKPIIV